MYSPERFVQGSEPRKEAAELKTPEVHGALLRELLEELNKDDVAIVSSYGRMEYVVQALEVCHPSPLSEAPSSEKDRVLVQNLDWLEEMMPPSEEVKMGWYGDEMAGTMEFHYVVEDGNWEFSDGIAYEEMGYGCLWENS